MDRRLNAPLITLAALAAILAAALAGCHTGVCTDNQNSIPCAGFYSDETGEAISISGLTIGGVGAPNDSLLYGAGESLSTVYLPLRSLYDNTAFRFHFTENDTTDPETGEVIYDGSADDYIQFLYTSTPYFDGEDCGAMYHYTIQDVRYTQNYISRVEVLDPLIVNTDAVRIAIFFHTQSPDEGEGGDNGGEEPGNGSDSGDVSDNGEGAGTDGGSGNGTDDIGEGGAS